MTRVSLLLGAMSVLAVVSTTSAEVVVFQEGVNGSTQEVWFSGNSAPSPTHSAGSNQSIGWSDPLSSAGLGASARAHITVIKFDDILNQIPEGVIVSNATLRVTEGDSGGSNGTGSYNVHRVLVDWSESPLSVGNFDGGGSGDDLIGPDAFFSGTEVSTTFATSTSPTGRSGPGSTYAYTDVTDDVQGFLDGDYENYGWALVKPSGQSPGWTLLGINGGQSGITGFEDYEIPLLEVTYFFPPLTPEPSTIVLWVMMGAFGLVAAWRQHRRRGSGQVA